MLQKPDVVVAAEFRVAVPIGPVVSHRAQHQDVLLLAAPVHAAMSELYLSELYLSELLSELLTELLSELLTELLTKPLTKQASR